MGPRHLPAFFGAGAAGLGAALAVIHLVLPALRSARLADLRAHAAKVRGEARVARHEGGGEPAGLGAVAVKADAFGHHLHVALAEAGVSAVLAFLGAADAGLDA